MKIKDLRQIIREEIKSVLSENQPAPAKPRETPGREVAEPGTKPGKEEKRRKLGNPNVKPAPKAKATLKEADIISKITKRFKSKQMDELLTLGDYNDSKKSDSKAKPLYTDKEIEAMTPQQAKAAINKGIWNVPANSNVLKKLREKSKQ